MTEAAPITRNRMSEYMRVRSECEELRVDQAVAFLEKTVIANTNNVRRNAMARVKGEGKTLWSVTDILEKYDGPEIETAEEFYGRNVMLESQKKKDHIKRRISEIEVITLVGHPDVYSVIHKANLVKMVSGDAGATQQDPKALAPIAELRATEEEDFVCLLYTSDAADE